jgi:hypothetical protein
MQVYLIKVWFSSKTELVNLKVEANIEEYIFFYCVQSAVNIRYVNTYHFSIKMITFFCFRCVMVVIQ